MSLAPCWLQLRCLIRAACRKFAIHNSPLVNRTSNQALRQYAFRHSDSPYAAVVYTCRLHETLSHDHCVGVRGRMYCDMGVIPRIQHLSLHCELPVESTLPLRFDLGWVQIILVDL